MNNNTNCFNFTITISLLEKINSDLHKINGCEDLTIVIKRKDDIITANNAIYSHANDYDFIICLVDINNKCISSIQVNYNLSNSGFIDEIAEYFFIYSKTLETEQCKKYNKLLRAVSVILLNDITCGNIQSNTNMNKKYIISNAINPISAKSLLKSFNIVSYMDIDNFISLDEEMCSDNTTKKELLNKLQIQIKNKEEIDVNIKIELTDLNVDKAYNLFNITLQQLGCKKHISGAKREVSAI